MRASVRHTEADWAEVVSVDHTEMRKAPGGDLFFLLLKTIVVARGESPCGRGGYAEAVLGGGDPDKDKCRVHRG